MENPVENRLCPNCHTPLDGDPLYCPVCGQKKIHPGDHSVWHLVIDSVGDFFHLDSKFMATIWPLLLRPGYLTKEFMRGRRARYFQPFKLFLFISFIYFLTSGIMEHKSRDPLQEIPGSHDTADVKDINAVGKGYNLSLSEVHDKTMDLPTDTLRKQVRRFGLSRFVDLNYPRASWLTRFLIKQTLKNRLLGGGTFGDNMKKTVPKLIFILIPIMALFLKLLYVRKKIPYFNHVIFSLHYLSFVFLLLWIKEFGALITIWLNTVAYLIMLIYLFVAMRSVYLQKWWGTLGRFLVLLLGYLLVMGIFFVTAAWISFLMI